MKVLMAWVGQMDLNSASDKSADGMGPIAQAIQDLDFDKVVLFYNYPTEKVEPFLVWLGSHQRRYQHSKPALPVRPTTQKFMPS